MASEDTISNGLRQQQEIGQIDTEKTIEIPADDENFVTSENKDTKRKNRRKSSNSNATSENDGMEYQIHDNEEIPLQFFSHANKNKRNNRKKSNSSEVSSKSINNSEKIPTEEVNPDDVNIAENTKIKRRRLSSRKMSLDLKIDEHFNSSVCNTTLESKNEYKQTADYDSTTANKQLINTVDGKRTKRRKSSAKTREIEHHSPSSDSQQQQQNPIPNDIVPNDFIVEPALLEQNNEELLVQTKKVVKSRKGWRKSMDPLNSTSNNWSVVSPEKWRTSTHPLTSTSTNWSVVSPDKIPHQSAAVLPESSEHNNPNEINTKKIISKKRSKKKKITEDHVVPEISNNINDDVFEELPPPPAKKKRGRKKKKDAGVIVEATNKNISDLVNFNETFDMVGLPVSNDSSILETAPSPKKKRGRKKKEAGGIVDVVENNDKVKLDDLNVLKSEKINETLDVVHHDDVLETPSPKKKRGRKKKIDLEQVPEKLELNNEVFTTENKKTKKRGRKKKVEAVPNEAAADENLLATGSNLNSVEDLAAEGQQQFEQQNKLAAEKKQTKKRVRKKKSVEAVVNEAADIITEEFESPKVEEVSFEANHPGEGQKKAKKRGRKKKKEVPIVVETDNITVAIDAVDHQEEGLEGGLQAQVISNSTATENNLDSPSLENVIEKSPSSQKRPRKKKTFWVYEEDPIGQYVVLPKPAQNDSLLAFQNEVKSAGNQFISSEENVIVKIKENNTKKSKSVPIQPLATDDLKQPEITPIENKKSSGKSKKAKKRKRSLIEEQQESPDAPELEDPSPSPKKGRTGSASAGRKSMTSDVASSAAAPKKTEKKGIIRKKNKKTPRRRSIKPEALPPKTFNQDEVVVDDDENQFHEKFHETEVIVTQPRKNNPTASLRTNMRSTDESKRTTRTQESKSKWEHVLNTNPETMFRKQK